MMRTSIRSFRSMFHRHVRRPECHGRRGCVRRGWSGAMLLLTAAMLSGASTGGCAMSQQQELNLGRQSHVQIEQQVWRTVR